MHFDALYLVGIGIDELPSAPVAFNIHEMSVKSGAKYCGVFPFTLIGGYANILIGGPKFLQHGINSC